MRAVLWWRKTRPVLSACEPWHAAHTKGLVCPHSIPISSQSLLCLLCSSVGCCTLHSQKRKILLYIMYAEPRLPEGHTVLWSVPRFKGGMLHTQQVAVRQYSTYASQCCIYYCASCGAGFGMLCNQQGIIYFSSTYAKFVLPKPKKGMLHSQQGSVHQHSTCVKPVLPAGLAMLNASTCGLFHIAKPKESFVYKGGMQSRMQVHSHCPTDQVASADVHAVLLCKSGLTCSARS